MQSQRSDHCVPGMPLHNRPAIGGYTSKSVDQITYSERIVESSMCPENRIETRCSSRATAAQQCQSVDIEIRSYPMALRLSLSRLDRYTENYFATDRSTGSDGNLSRSDSTTQRRHHCDIPRTLDSWPDC